MELQGRSFCQLKSLILCHTYSYRHAGYIGSVGLLEVIKRVVLTLREYNQNLSYVCDPVLGDDGKLYLPAEMVPLYSKELVSVATVLTPNQFEAEQLTGQEIRTEQQALQACRSLLQQGPSTVVSPLSHQPRFSLHGLPHCVLSMVA